MKRAEFDLQCPVADLRVHNLDEGTRGVVGCGKRATYTEVCNAYGWAPINCRWVLNSPEGATGTRAPTQQAPPSPPPQ